MTNKGVSTHLVLGVTGILDKRYKPDIISVGKHLGGNFCSMSLEVGAIVEGVVTGITHFGAFVQLANGETGLVHISEVADTYVKDINEHLQKKDKVKVKILSIDGKGKIGLSIKQANTNGRAANQSKASRLSFEDKLSKFLKESDERLQDLRRNTESKRGGRGSPFPG